MLDGQQERVDIPAHAKTAHKGFQQKKKNGRESVLNRPLGPPDDPIGQRTELNSTAELNGNTAYVLHLRTDDDDDDDDDDNDDDDDD